jgi:hypothetical protein
MRSFNLTALQHLSKTLLLVPGSYMLSTEFGELPLHRVHRSGPRLFKESLYWLEHSESSDSRRGDVSVLLLLLLLLLLLRLSRRSRLLYSLWHLGVGLHYALWPRLHC